MSGEQTDTLCWGWLHDNCGYELVSDYAIYSLMIPIWNCPQLNDTLEDLKLELCLSFGPEQSLRATDYYQDREKLKLTKDKTPVPDMFTEPL